MKKILMSLLLVGLIVNISSCDKKIDPEPSTCDMCGTYTGNARTNDTLRIHVGSIVNLDTTFSTLASTAVVTKSLEDDSLDLTVSLVLAGVAIDVAVTGYKTSATKLTITDKIYNYNNITDILVNGSVDVSGDDAVADILLSKAPGAPASILIEGNLTFEGSK